MFFLLEERGREEDHPRDATCTDVIYSLLVQVIEK
jgi:hypothetical protein